VRSRSAKRSGWPGSAPPRRSNPKPTLGQSGPLSGPAVVHQDQLLAAAGGPGRRLRRAGLSRSSRPAGDGADDHQHCGDIALKSLAAMTWNSTPSCGPASPCRPDLQAEGLPRLGNAAVVSGVSPDHRPLHREFGTPVVARRSLSPSTSVWMGGGHRAQVQRHRADGQLNQRSCSPPSGGGLGSTLNLVPPYEPVFVLYCFICGVTGFARRQPAGHSACSLYLLALLGIAALCGCARTRAVWRGSSACIRLAPTSWAVCKPSRRICRPVQWPVEAIAGALVCQDTPPRFPRHYLN